MLLHNEMIWEFFLKEFLYLLMNKNQWYLNFERIEVNKTIHANKTGKNVRFHWNVLIYPSHPLFRKPIIIIYLYYIGTFQKAKPNTLRELNIWTQCLYTIQMEIENLISPASILDNSLRSASLRSYSFVIVTCKGLTQRFSTKTASKSYSAFDWLRHNRFIDSISQ